MSDHTTTPKAVVEAYIHGTKTRDVALLKTIFADGAKMTGYLGPDLVQDGPEPFYGALEANEVGGDYTAEITALTEADKIASASIVEKNLLGMSFDNHFHLMQLEDGTWRIASKLFRHY